MASLARVMLDVARHVTGVVEGTAQSGTTSTLVDTILTQTAGYWKGSALFLNCEEATPSNDIVTPVLRFGEGTLTFATQTAPVTSATCYALVNPEFTVNEIKQAVLSILRQRPVEYVDETMTAASGTLEYTLPAGVSGIRRMIVDGTINQHWREQNGELVFLKAPADGVISIYYYIPQGTIALTTTVNAKYDYDWLKWSAVVNLLRMKVQRVHKDNPILMELLNEAKTEEQKARAASRPLPLSDIILAG